MGVEEALQGAGAARYPSLDDFESARIDPARFDHRAHVYVGWLYLRRHSTLDAIRRYCRALQRLTYALGAAGKYHETITWFFLLQIAERAAQDPDASWAEFEAANPDLCGDGRDLLDRFYTHGRLRSPLARRQFLLPDRCARPENE